MPTERPSRGGSDNGRPTLLGDNSSIVIDVPRDMFDRLNAIVRSTGHSKKSIARIGLAMAMHSLGAVTEEELAALPSLKTTSPNNRKE